MLVNSRILAVLLLSAMAAALPGVQAFALSSTPPAHLMGCHSHGPATPIPAPVGYQCCMNGHNWTIPIASFSERPLLAQFAKSDRSDDFSLVSVLSAHVSIIVVPASSPPAIAPLRI